MVSFLIGLIIGGILGIIIVSLLSAGAFADEQMENIMNKM